MKQIVAWQVSITLQLHRIVMAPFVAVEKGGTRESLVAHVTWETPISHVNVPFMFFLGAFAKKKSSYSNCI